MFQTYNLKRTTSLPMKNYLFRLTLLSLTWLAALVTHNAAGQSQPLTFSNVTPLNDSSRRAYLHQHGVQLQAGAVTAWFPKDSLSPARMRAIVDTLNLGVQSVKEYLKAPLSWQRLSAGQPITFYYSPGKFISHASQRGFTLEPFWRIKSKMNLAGWLHEATHEILAPAQQRQSNYADVGEEEPQWLTEGAAEYITLRVSTDKNLPKLDLFKGGNLQQIDQSCLTLLKTSKGAYTLAYIGSPGVMPELGGPERRAYAPAFYNCSCSFNKYLVTQYGIGSLMAVVGAFPEEQKKLREISGLSPDELRQKWLQAINAPAGLSGPTYLQPDSLASLLKAANLQANKIPVSRWFRQTMTEKGIAVAIKQLQAAWKSQNNKYKYSENYLNKLGYNLLDNSKIKESIAVFGLNAEMYPHSANAYDSWAEAYLKAGQTELAKKYYNKSLALDPNNSNAKAVLQSINK